MRTLIIRYSRLLATITAIALILGTPSALAATEKPKTTAKTTDTAKTAKPTDISSAVSQSYNADKSVQTGMIVQLKTKDSTTVVALDAKTPKAMLGIVIPSNSSPIVLSPTTPKDQQVLVATGGRQTVVVSNQNGPIKIGDYISISAIDGIGMKAGEQQEQVTGKAAGNFSGTSNVIGTVKVKDSLGKESAISLGRIPVDVNITHNPLFQKTVDYVPGFLAAIAVTVANKPVSVARIYLCTVILFITAILAGNMLYSGVRGGMIAVGRNPLSKKSIIKSLIQTVAAGLIVFVVGVFAVYLILKL